MPGHKLHIDIKPPKGEDGHKTFSVRLKNGLVAQLDEISAATGRSRNEIMGLLLEFAVEHCEISSQE